MQRFQAVQADAANAQYDERELQWIALRLRLHAIGTPTWCEGKSTKSEAAAASRCAVREVRGKAQPGRLHMAEGSKRVLQMQQSGTCAKSLPQPSPRQQPQLQVLRGSRPCETGLRFQKRPVCPLQCKGTHPSGLPPSSGIHTDPSTCTSPAAREPEQSNTCASSSCRGQTSTACGPGSFCSRLGLHPVWQTHTGRKKRGRKMPSLQTPETTWGNRSRWGNRP